LGPPGSFLGRSALLFSPTGNYIQTIAYDGTLYIWNTETGELVVSDLASIGGGVRTTVDATISPDEKYLLVVSDDKAYLYEIGRVLKRVLTFSGHIGALTSARFSADGKYIVTTSADKTARVWDASVGSSSSGRLVAELRGHTGAINSARFDRTGRYVVTAGDDKTAR